jgi:hypothetical protein
MAASAESPLIPVAVFVLLAASTAAGAYVQARLPERHRSSETTSAVRDATGMIVTFAAVVLGLLTSSASDAFKEVDGHLRSYAAVLIELDQTLRDYGPGADPMREALRAYTAAAIADTWRDENPPAGDYYARPPPGRPGGSMENLALGRMLSRIEVALRHLDPADPFHQGLASASLATMGKLLDRRWAVIQSAQNGVSVPVLAVLLLWLAVVFVCFGLTAPPNALARAIIGLSAFVLASAVFLLLELEYPFSGFVAVSSAPLRDALQHMGR